MVELFDWQERPCRINLSMSGIEPFLEIDKLKKENEDPLIILSKRYGVDKECVNIVHSAQEALFLSLLALKPNEIFIPIPAYPPMYEQAQELGIRVNFVDDVYELREKMIVLANPNNPTGKLIDVEKLIKNGNFVIIDEIFKYFIKEKDEYIENSIIISGTSKFFNFKDRKVAWIISEKNISKRIKHLKDLITPEPISEKILIQYIYNNFDFFKERNKEIILNNLRIIKKNKIKKFKIIYNEMMPVTALERENLDSLNYCERLLMNKGILLTPLKFFKKDNAIRIFIGTKNHKIFEEAIIEINEFNEKNLFD